MNKKAINLLLILLMSMVGLQAHADWDTSNKVKVDNLYYYLDEENHQAQVTSMPQGAFYVDPRSIPDNIWYNNQKYSVTSIGPGAFSHCYKLTSVTISNSVTSIGDDAFLNCEKLSEITIPNSVTSIGRNAFMACKELRRIYIPNSVTFIGDGAFIGTDLVSLIVDVNNPKYDSRDNCNAIIETATNKLIRGCRFTVIPNSVTSIGNEAFGNILFDNGTFSCIIPNSVTSIGDYAFWDSPLHSITIGNSVTSIGYQAFYECKDLKKVIVPDLAAWCGIEFGNPTANPLYYAHHLYSDKNTEITNLIIPNSVTSIGAIAFSGCSGLTSVAIPNSVTSISSGAFSGCTGLTSINVDANNPKYDSRDNCNAIIEKGTNTLVVGCKNSVIPSSVTNIGNYAFYGCSGLTSVTIPNSVTSIGGGAFADCEGLTSVKVYAKTPPTAGYNAFPTNQTITLYVPRGSKAAYETANVWKDFGSIIEFGIAVTANDLTMVYGDEVPELTYKTEGGSITGTPQITCEATSTSPVGTYPIVISKGSIDSDEVTYVNGKLTITKAPLTITAKSYSIKQGEALPTFEAEYSGFKNNETSSVLTTQPTITTSATSESPLGTYDIVVSGADAQNYDITYVKGTLTITPSAESVTVTAKSYSRMYGEANPTFEYTTAGATLSGTPSITCDATATSPVGEYDIVVSKGTVTNKYVTYENGKLTITKAPLTITAKSYTIKQGDALPSFEAEYAGFKNSETSDVLTTQPTITTTATSASAPGAYDIVISGASATNYDITHVKGTLTIAPPSAEFVTVAAKSYSRMYGEANPTFEFTTTGATLSGTPSITCEATATSPVGEYDIVVSKGTVTNKYVTYENGKLTITKAPLTITAKSYTIMYGNAMPTFEADYDGFKNNETEAVLTKKPTITTSATSSSTPGTYDIIVSGADATNYDINYVKGTLTIEGGINGIFYEFNGDEAIVVAGPYKYQGDVVIPASVNYQSKEYSVTGIGNNAFSGCSDLTSITIPTSVTSIGDRAFYGCSGLTSITIPTSVTSIGSWVFTDCSGLTKVTINNNTIVSKNYSFSGSLEGFFGTQVKEYIIGDEVQSIGNNAFSGCKGLISVTIGKSVTEIGQWAFSGCSDLTIVTINSNAIVSQNYSLSSSFNAVFGSQVKEYIIGDEVQSIGDYAFYGCLKLISVTIPNSVTSIGIGAFLNCI